MKILAAPGLEAREFRRWGKHLSQYQCVTCIMVHSNGAIGFERVASEGGLGLEAASAVMLPGILIGPSNVPDWEELSAEKILALARVRGGRCVVVTGGSRRLVAELSAASRRRLIGRKNELLRKAARSEESLPASVFADWIEEGGWIQEAALAFLVEESRCLLLWGRSEWGLYCVLVAATVQVIEERLGMLADVSGIFVEWRKSIADLPSW